MRFSILILCSSVLYTTQVLAAFRPDLKENVQVAEPEDGDKIPDGATEITMKAYPGSDFEFIFKCVENTKQLTFSDCKHWVACCRAGQRLLGSEETAFDCCEVGEELVGNEETRYKCCLPGQIFDGVACKFEDNGPCCPDGEVSVNGVCVCPAGTVRTPNGSCEALDCSSGVTTGKCYTFTFENGYRFGYNSAGFYTASEENRAQQFGKFLLCAEENCTAVVDINPGDGFSIKDIHGEANGGKYSKQWLNNAKDGEHITKTPDYAQSGTFVLTKWPCGKYCLGGFDAGVGPTCPTEMVGATFTTADDQSCIPVTLLEVPCDIRATINNCIWDSKADQCGGYRECALPPLTPRIPIYNETSPVPSSTGEEVVLNATISIDAQVAV